jgi:DNA-binding MarR family transcriptional regulator
MNFIGYLLNDTITQDPPDMILWTLHEHGSMKRSELRRCTGLRLHELVPILEDLERGGRIRIDRDTISLI